MLKSKGIKQVRRLDLTNDVEAKQYESKKSRNKALKEIEDAKNLSCYDDNPYQVITMMSHLQMQGPKPMQSL